MRTAPLTVALLVTTALFTARPVDAQDNAAAVATAATTAAPGIRIVAKEIEALTAAHAEVAGMNNRGDIVGTVAAGPGVFPPFKWTAQNGIEYIAGNASGWALDVNERGDVVGYVLVDEFRTAGFLWTAATGYVDLGDFVPAAINNLGHMAGACVSHDVRTHSTPCLWIDGEITELADDGTSGAINDRDEVSGQALIDNQFSAFVWSPGTGLKQLPHQPGHTAPGSATSMNDRREIVGADDGAPVRWTRSGAIRSLTGEPTGVTVGVNAAGWAVGRYSVPIEDGSNSWEGFVWTPEGAVVPFGLALPAAINDSGQILGMSIDARRVMLWQIRRDAPPLHIETPNTDTRWGLGTTQLLAWTYGGDAPQFLIDISRNSGKTWTPLTVVNNDYGGSQNFYWQVAGPQTSAAKFRVTAVGDPGASDVNDTNVRIAKATVEILQPTRTTSVPSGSVLTVAFKHSLGNMTRIAIDVSANNGSSWRTVTEMTVNGSTTATFHWNVDIVSAERARVRVRALDGSAAVGLSPAFAIMPAGPASAPAGGAAGGLTARSTMP